MRRTRIVATIGPASRDRETLDRLVTAGVDVVRVNFSHGSHEEHGEVVARVREAADRAGRAVAVLQDLAGPKIRTGPLHGGPVELADGAAFTLTAREVPGDAREVGLTWPGLPGAVAPGDLLLLADGALRLEVREIANEDIRCTVRTGGELGAHKGINLPGRSLDVPILTEKDRADLAFGLSQGVDLVAASFVRTAGDVDSVRAAMAGSDHRPPLIAKIEKFEALDNIDAILARVDGIMVARGDLGVEIPIEKVPGAQKRLIALANRAAKPVITATQMLRSMVHAPQPTRAEATDVANAILDGTDAVMLSEETAVGDDPVHVVETMARIAVEVERDFPHRRWAREQADAAVGDATAEEAVARSACAMAEDIGAAAIIACTMSGSTALKVARYRPRQPLLTLSPAAATRRRLALTWGTVPLELPEAEEFEALERGALELAVAGGFVQPGEQVVLVAGLPFRQRGTTNLIKVCVAPGSDAEEGADR